MKADAQFFPGLIFPLPLEGSWPCRKHPHAHFTAGFHTYWFSLNSWCKCFYFFCSWFLKSLCNLHVDIQRQLTWAQWVTNCDENSDAESVRTALSSARRQCCTYITPTTGLSGPQCRNCWTEANGWQTMTDSSAKRFLVSQPQPLAIHTLLSITFPKDSSDALILLSWAARHS